MADLSLITKVIGIVGMRRKRRRGSNRKKFTMKGATEPVFSKAIY